MESINGKSGAANLAMLYSLVVLVVKIAIIFVSGGLSVVSDSIDAMSDIVLLVLLKRIIQKSTEPVDSEHPYGKGKYESLGAIIQFVVVTVIYAIIVYSAIGAIATGSAGGVGNGAVAAATFVGFAASNILFGTYLRRKGARLDSEAIKIQGLGYSMDGLRSLLVLAATVLSIAGAPLADPIFAICISAFVILMTLRSCRGALDNLVERNPLAPEELIMIYDEVPHVIPDIMAVTSVRVKKVGDVVFITMDILMDEAVSLKVAHEKMEQIEGLIRTLFPDRQIEFSIHPHP
ncbi:MAG: cation diffusion facilitator family transporter [Candidatus Lokiarchaeota archaeon]|nr:cation diffusion facilitator family transporter [Candidatus Lokiarchaeota archaeon]